MDLSALRRFILSRGLLPGALALGALAAVLAFGTAAASAEIEVKHPKAGEITEANGSPLVEPWGLAFDSSGNLLVGEPANKVVDVFNSLNAFQCQIGAGEFPENFTRNVTVNNAKGLVYVGESGPEQVWVYKHESGCTYKLVQKVQFEHFLEVAYDNSNGPNKGDLYVVGAPHKVWVAKTNSEGLLGEGKPEELTLFGSLPTLTPPVGGFELSGENGKGAITVDGANGDLYMTEPSHKVISEYSPKGEFVKQFAGTATPAKSFEPFGVAVEESTGDLYVWDHAHHVIDQFSSTGTYIGQIAEGLNSEDVSVAVSNAGTTKGRVYVSDVTSGSAKIEIYAAGSKKTLEVKKVGNGVGEVKSSPGLIECGSICTGEFDEGIAVELTAKAEAGSVFGEWKGACTGTTNPCKLTMSQNAVVEAEFTKPLAKFPLKVKTVGDTEVVGKEIKCKENAGTCSEEREETRKVELTATKIPGWKFKKWSGASCEGGDETTKCVFTMPASEVKITAESEETHAAPLTVFVTGEGHVSSSPTGISECGPIGGTCSAEFEGTVTLTGTPASGYVLVGWLGCKHATATTCEVEINGATEVTAVFLKEGKQGEEGPEGPPGSEGMTGREGLKGSIGPVGPRGEEGKEGKAGPAGAAGPQGPAGAPGKVQLVKCTTVKQGKKSVQKCTTQLVAGPVTFKAAKASVHATLSRHGVVYASGLAQSTSRGHMSLRLLPVRALRAGRYTLTLIAGSGRHETIRTESFTLG